MLCVVSSQKRGRKKDTFIFKQTSGKKARSSVDLLVLFCLQFFLKETCVSMWLKIQKSLKKLCINEIWKKQKQQIQKSQRFNSSYFSLLPKRFFYLLRSSAALLLENFKLHLSCQNRAVNSVATYFSCQIVALFTMANEKGINYFFCSLWEHVNGCIFVLDINIKIL